MDDKKDKTPDAGGAALDAKESTVQPSSSVLFINESLQLPMRELDFRAVLSGGPGGQHVNKTATKVMLSFDVQNSESLDERQRELLLSRLGNQLTKDGVLQVSSQASRSQKKNREDALDKLQHAIAKALQQKKKRKATRPSAGAKRRRLEAKKRRSRLKQSRNKNWDS